jgi:F-type H+-transporting ATPase subunit epsilon
MSTWKNVGMTYLKYADLCATHIRNALKEPAKSKASNLSNMHARVQQWENGVRGKPGTHRPLASSTQPLVHAAPF